MKECRETIVQRPAPVAATAALIPMRTISRWHAQDMLRQYAWDADRWVESLGNTVPVVRNAAIRLSYAAGLALHDAWVNDTQDPYLAEQLLEGIIAVAQRDEVEWETAVPTAVKHGLQSKGIREEDLSLNRLLRYQLIVQKRMSQSSERVNNYQYIMQ